MASIKRKKHTPFSLPASSQPPKQYRPSHPLSIFDSLRRNKSSSPAIPSPVTLVNCYGKSTPGSSQTKFFFSLTVVQDSSNLPARCRLRRAAHLTQPTAAPPHSPHTA